MKQSNITVVSMTQKSTPFYHDFGQNEDAAEIADVRLALPRIFDLVSEENGVYRSDPEQIVGIFTRNRVFGGQLFTQFYMVAKEEAKKRGYQVQRLTVLFRRPGKANQPIRYSHDSNRPMNSTFLSLKAEQNDQMDLMPFFLRGIPKPLDCLELKSGKSTLHLDSWLQKYGNNSLNVAKLDEKSEIFELRPVDLNTFGGLNSDQKVIRCWARLAESLRKVEIKEPLFVPMAISDFLSCHPAIVALDQMRIRFTSGASLSHRCTFHRHNRFDAKAFFLVEIRLDCLNKSGLYSGNVFTQDGQCILSFIQSNFNQYDITTEDLKSRL
ncbi:hypothetical protein M3Y95_00669500 [Aphelenchoides besseyi]|nr:hypothetical protein M3Y95_00669500 [Aphelenchoides besseyi]